MSVLVYSYQLSMTSLAVQYQRCTYGNSVSLLFFKVFGLA